MMGLLWVGVAVVAAMAAVAVAAWAYVKRCQEVRRLQELRRLGGADTREDNAWQVEGVAAKVLSYVVQVDARGASGGFGSGRMVSKPGKRLEVRLATVTTQAGMKEVAPAACAQAASRLAAMAAAVGAAVGAAISPQMAVFLGVIAAIAGASAPVWAIRQERAARAEALARQLPEMLDVCALGLRSGLTFDRSIALYATYATGTFARECASAMEAVSLGLTTRKEALRELALSYDSPHFARIMEGVEQSLLRGTSLIGDLERSAEEARKTYRARKEQVVAKAPIKMMLPIGTMILPAMLLLILGPVVLGFVQGM